MTTNDLTRFDARTVTDDHLIELIYGDYVRTYSKEELRRALKLLRTNNKTVVSLIKKVVSTGEAASREAVLVIIRKALDDVTDAFNASGGDVSWEYQCYGLLDDDLANRLNTVWHLNQLHKESGSTEEVHVVSERVSRLIARITSSSYPFTLNTGSVVYWRGLMALAFSNVMYRNDKNLRQRAQAKASYDFDGQINDFIKWAGKHPDVRVVIDTARERKTIDVLALQEIIEQGAENPAVSSGAI